MLSVVIETIMLIAVLASVVTLWVMELIHDCQGILTEGEGLAKLTSL